MIGVPAAPWDLRTIATAAAVFVAGWFVALAVGTLVSSAVRYLRDRRREAIRDRLRRDGNADEAWIDGLTRTEREQLESIVERYLRMLRGGQREQYRAVAAQLGMGKRADRALDRPGVTPRLRALARLSLLEYPIARERLFHTCLDTRRTREAAARLVEQRRDGFADPEITGTTLLLFDRERPLTRYGLETLYDLNDADPMPLLIRADREASAWTPALLVQVCTVLEHCRAVVRPEMLDWAFPLFDHEEPLVRAAAIGLFRRHGWRRELRDRLPFRGLVTDEDPRVRRRTYEVLAAWGDESARQLLEWAVIDEADSRCQLVAVRALASLGTDPATESRAWPADAWRWINAELQADRSQLLPVERPVGPEEPPAGSPLTGGLIG